MIGKFCRTERIVGVESPNAFFHFCFTLSLSCDKMNKTDFYKVLEAVEMKKKRIVYSLTGRGLFSELSNLALALVYADYNQEELTVNTRNCNA